MQKTAQCVEMHDDPEAVHVIFALDPPCIFHDAETAHFRIIEVKGQRGRQIVADNGSWLHISGTGGDLPLDAYLSRYYGYHESLTSQLRRLRGRWGDLDRPPKNAPYEVRMLWSQLDEVQRLLVAMMADRMARAVEQARAEHVDDLEEWDDA